MRIQAVVHLIKFGAYRQFSVPNRHLRVAAKRYAFDCLSTSTCCFTQKGKENKIKTFNHMKVLIEHLRRSFNFFGDLVQGLSEDDFKLKLGKSTFKHYWRAALVYCRCQRELSKCNC